MDNFIEWLSDNLRYFILGVLVILVLVIAFVGIRAASSRLGDDEPKSPTTQEAKDNTPEEQQGDVSDPGVTGIPTEVDGSANANVLEKNAHPQVNAVVQKYYQALSAKDIDGINAVADELEPAEATKIIGDQHIDGYSDVEVYTKDGAREGEYVVLARYNYKFKDIDKEVPGLSMMYVKPREDGSLYVTMKGEEVQDCITKTRAEDDVNELIKSVESDYAKAQEEDEELRNFISGFGIASSKAASAEDGSTVTIKGDCNVRESASVDGEVVTQLQAGTQVTKTGTQGDWIAISFKDTDSTEKTGYVRSDLFE